MRKCFYLKKHFFTVCENRLIIPNIIEHLPQSRMPKWRRSKQSMSTMKKLFFALHISTMT